MNPLRLILISILLIPGISGFCQDVTLVVTGEGKTKDEAVLSALREAVSEAYTSYISSKTEVNINDVYSDKITMLTHGEIKSYRELAYKDANTYKTVTLKAIVSCDIIKKYIQNFKAGDHVSINGSAFVSNRELKLANEGSYDDVMKNVGKKLEFISKTIYTYKLSASEPYINRNYGCIDLIIYCKSNPNMSIYEDEYVKSIQELWDYMPFSKTYEFSHYFKNLYHISCFGFTINDNLGNSIVCKYCDKSVREHSLRVCMERFDEGGGVYCISNNVDIERKTFPTIKYNDRTKTGVVKFTLKYPLNDLKKLTEITIL